MIGTAATPDGAEPVGAAAGREKELYVVLVTHRGDETLGAIIGSWGLHLTRGEDGTIAVSLADLPAAEDISVDGTTDEIRQLRKELERVQNLLSRSYTKEEPLRMQNDKLREIQEADTSIKMAELDLRRKQAEASDSSVYSQLDGVVKAVRTPTDVAANNEAVVEVSAGGGYYVTGTVSEARLDTVKVGQTVNIRSWMTGTACTGEVVEISTHPTDGDSHGGDGNPNVSYYPFKVFVSEDQQLQEGENVSISYQAVSDSDGSTCIWRICTSARKTARVTSWPVGRTASWSSAGFRPVRWCGTATPRSVAA